ncbi:MAG: hypothetical protein ACQETL_17520 [Bacteroidota bacterium]
MTKVKNGLICLMHYNRVKLLETFAPFYYNFCIQNDEFDFLVAIDGNNAELIKTCEKHKLPFMYSEQPEGVGISKNRVFQKFPNYNYYFFIDDDVELFDFKIFYKSIELHKQTHIHHFALGEEFRFFGNRKEKIINNQKVIFSDYGSGAFSFFSNYGLKKVGGFHDEFAKYKRFGHTEHSSRFKNCGLAETNFIFPLQLSKLLIWHNPDSKKPKIKDNDNKISIVEENILSKSLVFYPFKTISKFYYKAGAIPDYFPLKSNNYFGYLPKAKARTALARRCFISARNFYLDRKYWNSKKMILKYLLCSFPNTRFKKISLLIIFYRFCSVEYILKEFKNARY